MMAQPDGAVYIETKISPEGAEQGAQITEERVREMVTNTENAVRKMTDTIKDAETDGLSEGFQGESEQIKAILDDTERSAKAKAAAIAAIYKKQGMSQSEAMKKAWEQIERESKTSTNTVKKNVDSIGDEAVETGQEIKTHIGGSFSSVSSGAKKLGGSFSALAGKIKNIAFLAAGAFSLTKLVSFGKDAINLGSDLSEVQNVVDVTFEDLNEEVNDFAKNAIKQFGLSETSAKQFSSTMGAMLKSMGFTKREAADMGMKIAGLAGDLASFYNLDAAEAFAKIRSGISGETEPLKQLGINMSVANLEQYAMQQGMKKTYQKMNQQEQALLRYNYLLSVTADAQGDFTRTSEGWANQTRILSEQFNSLKATIGQGLINLFSPLIRQLNVLVEQLQKAGEAFLRFTVMLTGADQETAAASGAAQVARAFEDVTEATEKAEEAQSSYLSGLDEITKFSETASITEPETDVAIPGTDISATTPSVDVESVKKGSSLFDKIAKAMKKIVSEAKALASIFSESFFATGGDKILGSLSSIKESLAGLGRAYLDAFSDTDVQQAAKDFVTSFLRAMGALTGAITNAGTTIASQVLEGFKNYFANNEDTVHDNLVRMISIRTRLNEIIQTLAEDLNYVFDTAFSSGSLSSISENLTAIFSEYEFGIINETTALATDVVDRLVRIFTDNKERLSKALAGTLEELEAVTESIRKGVGVITDTILPNLRKGFDGLLDLLTPLTDFLADVFFETWNDLLNPALNEAAQLVSDLADIYDDLWNKVLAPLGEFIGDAFAPVISKLEYVMRSLWSNAMKPLYEALLEVFVPAWDSVVAFVRNILLPWWNKLVSVLSFLWKNVMQPIVDFLWDTFKPAFDSILRLVRNFIDDLKNVLKGAFEFISGVFEGDWSKAWQGIKDVLTGIINRLIDGLNWVIEQPFNGINTVLRRLKSLEILKIKPFGWINEITVPQIPRLAQGAVIPPNAPFYAMLGDQRNGNNLEMPESLLRKIVREESGGNGVGSIDGNMTVKVYLSGRQVYEEVMRIADIVKAQSGRPQGAF